MELELSAMNERLMALLREAEKLKDAIDASPDQPDAGAKVIDLGDRAGKLEDEVVPKLEAALARHRERDPTVGALLTSIYSLSRLADVQVIAFITEAALNFTKALTARDDDA